MNAKKALVLVRSLLFVFLLALGLVLELVLAVSFLQANGDAFSIMPIVEHARAWEKVWMWIYLSSDAGYLAILAILFLELTLFLLRTMVVSAIRAIATISGRDPAPAVARVRKVSLATVFRKIGVDSAKKGIIVYVILLALVLGSGWIAKKVLDANDSLVYRSYVVKNLYSDELIADLASDIEDGDVYDIRVAAGVGNVHLYAVADATEAKLYFLYDEETEPDGLSWSVDPVANRIDVAFNEDADGYERYVDPVPPAIEIYLPADLDVGSVTVDVTGQGDLTVEYLVFQTLDADVAGGTVSVTAARIVVGDVDVTSRGGAVSARIDSCGTAAFTLLDGASASLSVGTAEGNLTVSAASESRVYVYASNAAALDVDAGPGCDLEFREVYAVTGTIDMDGGTLLYVNGDRSYEYGPFTITAPTTDRTLKGVPDDQNG